MNDQKCTFCPSYDVVMVTDAGHPVCAKCANKIPASVGMNKKAAELARVILGALTSKPKGK